MEFLKKHYEKMVLCVVLLGLAGAVVWMRSALGAMRERMETTLNLRAPNTKPPAPIDLTVEEQALKQISKPPPVLLSGEHNLFNPVTWKRLANGDLMKILKTGPDALVLTNTIPLYTIISYDKADGAVYHMNFVQHIDLKQPPSRTNIEFARFNEKPKSGLYVVRGIKGATNDPSELNLEITETGDTNVWVSTNAPYKRVDSYLADLRYDPDPSVPLLKKRVGYEFNLDNEQYKIVEITNDTVRVQNAHTTKVTVIRLSK